MARLRFRFRRLCQRLSGGRGAIFRAFGAVGGQEGKALSLSEQTKYLGRLRIDELNRPDVLRPQRDVDQPVARTQVEQRLSVREKSIPYRGQPRPHCLEPQIAGPSDARSSK